MKLKHFFWFCAGANKRLLSECDTDHARYLGIGATVFFTALFASLSSAYAMYFVFSGSPNAIWAAVGFGMVWGLTIFNIDRYLVLSLKKDSRPWKEFRMAAPRIVLALIIGIVIARPLELKIFDKEIKEALKQYYLENETQLITSKNRDFDSTFKAKFDQLSLKRKEFSQADSTRKSFEELRDFETYGSKTNRTTGKVGYGTEAKKRQVSVDKWQAIQDTFGNQISALETEINTKRAQEGLNKPSRLDNAALDSVVNTAGFLDRNKMLGQISSWTPLDWLFANGNTQMNTKSASATSLSGRLTQQCFDGKNDTTSFFISLLFICVECLPIFIKLMSSRSTYDIKLEEEDERMRFLIRHETYANKHLIQQLAVAQREVLTKAIEDWEESEMTNGGLGKKYITLDDDDK